MVTGVEVEKVLQRYLSQFVEENRAARVFAQGLEPLGVGLRPLIDHLTVRTLNVDQRAQEFLALGFEYDEEIGRLEFDNWWAKVYRRPGFPALFIDQGFQGERGEGSLIPPWVKNFGDKVLHHVAVQVDNIERAIADLKTKGIRCSGEIVGAPGTPLRQIFTEPEMRNGQPYSVLELAERRHGYRGFLPPQADGLMKSSILGKD